MDQQKQQDLARIRQTLRGALQNWSRHRDTRARGKAGPPNWRNVFDKYDRDRCGEICFEEFKKGARMDLRLPAKTISDTELRMAFSTVDKNDTDTVSLDELQEFVQKGNLIDEEFQRKEEIRRLERSRRNLNVALANVLGRVVTLKELIHLFERYDEDQSGYLSLFEFRFALRSDLRLKPRELPDDHLLSIFNHIAKDDGRITADELYAFLRTSVAWESTANVGKKGSYETRDSEGTLKPPNPNNSIFALGGSASLPSLTTMNETSYACSVGAFDLGIERRWREWQGLHGHSRQYTSAFKAPSRNQPPRGKMHATKMDLRNYCFGY